MTGQRPSPNTARDGALADVAEAFVHLRATRRHRREHTSPAPRTRAVVLLEHRRPSQVARALGLNPATLAHWAVLGDAGTAIVRDRGTPLDAFVPLPATTALVVPIDGFAARCRTLLGYEPTRGTLHVFINRRATMIRVLVHDDSGFWLMTKRLSKGRSGGWPDRAGDELSATSARDLRALLESGSWQGEPTAGRHARERAAPRRSCPAAAPVKSSLP